MNYQLKNNYLTIDVSDLGAELQSIQKDGKEYLWNGDATYWPDRSPVLFPFVGRFTNGKYYLNGNEYEMDIHGFARKYAYDVVEMSDDYIEFEMTDNAETLELYPYHFALRIAYTLKEKTVEITYKVYNFSEDTMYFGIGGHPGFVLPFDEGLEFTDYYLEFGGKSYPERVGHTPTCFLSGVNEAFKLEDDKVYRLHHDMFDDDAIVLQHVSDEVTLKSDKGSRQVTVSYPNLPFLGLWHAPKTEAPYICIEPWTSLPSRQDVVEEFRYKYDLIRLDAEDMYENTWSITIE